MTHPLIQAIMDAGQARSDPASNNVLSYRWFADELREAPGMWRAWPGAKSRRPRWINDGAQYWAPAGAFQARTVDGQLYVRKAPPA